MKDVSDAAALKEVEGSVLPALYFRVASAAEVVYCSLTPDISLLTLLDPLTVLLGETGVGVVFGKVGVVLGAILFLLRAAAA
jgi:hypothetical protein